jgi:uracil-DNA glycosylase
MKLINIRTISNDTILQLYIDRNDFFNDENIKKIKNYFNVGYFRIINQESIIIYPSNNNYILNESNEFTIIMNYYKDILENIKMDYKAFNDIPIELYDDKNYIIEAIKYNSHVISYISNYYKNDLSFMTNVVMNDGLMLRYASNKLKKNKEIVLCAIKQNVLALQYISDSLMNNINFLLEIINIVPETHIDFVLKYIPKYFKNHNNILLTAIKLKKHISLKKIHIGWNLFFDNNKNEFINIFNFLDNSNDIIYPIKENIFRALHYFSPSNIKLIILGQDPYINDITIDNIKIPQADGLAFSVSKNHKIPPSLMNIYKEIKNNYPDSIIPNHGCLERWSKDENILLLNSSLSVISGLSNSHQDIWNNFTDKLIKFISNENNETVFLLMGKFAINKQKLIDQNKHKIFITAHPSPLSAYRGFFGSNVFKNINDYLESKNIIPIKWL